MSFEGVLEEAVGAWFFSDEPFSEFIKRIKARYPKELKEWYEKNPLSEENRRLLDKVFSSSFSVLG